ncbi:sensor histidine kinase [Capsulimonas corticalis]|uniref:Sensor histidine kinase n=1 Tax=Capsulimonas corticalis TaxID=2219043 RepID=A0A402CZS0_9BACT|nr:universal stress protein [Capsulimonas corticalis]BDI33895.1 sensor histidine kinase [Capsulimonas corticalis]
MSYSEDNKRPTPEELLARLHRDERQAGRGRLKLFLGFAAGVGKTYEMLNEANRRKGERGQDVVIGYVVTHGRKDTEGQIGDLEIIPRKQVEYKGSAFEEMDTAAIIGRKPQWVVVDELAHTNVPGGAHAKRYEDVLDILAAGINVLSAMNVQHLESLNDTIQQITGVKVRETVPDWVLGEAGEIVSIDITPRALIHRLERGDVYPKEKVPQALANFFSEGNLCALREIALREVAGEVDRSVQIYREEHDVTEPWRTQEKIMICISPDQPSDRLLRRGWRIARRLRADLVAVYVASETITPRQQQILDADFALASSLSIRMEQVTSRDIAHTLAEYARSHQVTEIIIGHSGRTAWQEFLMGSIINKLIRLVRGIDVLVVANKL